MAKIIDVEGIGVEYAKKLKAVGIVTTDGLLKAGSTPKGREELASKSGVSEKLVLEWVNHADLYRIKGVGSEYSDLLEEAGVDTVPELAQRKPENLLEKMVEANAAKKLVRKLPALKQVEDWVDQAKKLPRVINY
jgi:predicted flap endonuclease-1-like 5' DNA nuclease